MEQDPTAMNNFDEFNGKPFFDRAIFLTGKVDAQNALGITSKILQYTYINERFPIVLFISSVGGELDSMWSIINLMNTVKTPIFTVVNGYAASAAAFISINATKGKRFIFPNSYIMLHEISYGFWGKYTDMTIMNNRVDYELEQIKKLVTNKTKIPKGKIQDFVSNKDKYFTVNEALEYGLADSIIDKTNMRDILSIMKLPAGTPEQA